MTMHNTKIVGRKIDEKFEVDLPTTKTEFIFPKIDDAETSKEIELSFKQQSDLHNQQNKLTIELLEKAVLHVRKYDSLETATKITAKAFHKCPSMFNKRLIVDANKSLKAAIKAEKWANSRRRKRHVDESTVRRNLDTYYEKVAEAVASIKLDLDKNSLKLFNKIRSQYESSLPLLLPADKKAVKKKAHVVVMTESRPNSKHKITRLEGNLFLIEDVIVLGINRNHYKKPSYTTLDKASELAAKLGATVYESIISRPSDNIDWYLVQDFGASVKFASFADKLDVTENPYGDNLSYEGFIKRQAEEQKAEQQLKTRRLRDVRQAFYDDNIMLFDDIRRLKIELDNLISERAEISAEFTAITTVSGEHSGIDVSQIRKLYGKSIDYRSQLQFEGRTFAEAHVMSFRQRIEAKACYYDYLDASERVRDIRSRIKFLEEETQNRKISYARKLGMVSTTKYAEIV